MSRSEWFNPTRLGTRLSVVELKTITPVPVESVESEHLVISVLDFLNSVSDLPSSDFTATDTEVEMMKRSKIFRESHPEIVKKETLLRVLITRAKRLRAEENKAVDFCLDNLIFYAMLIAKKDEDQKKFRDIG